MLPSSAVLPSNRLLLKYSQPHQPPKVTAINGNVIANQKYSSGVGVTTSPFVVVIDAWIRAESRKPFVMISFEIFWARNFDGIDLGRTRRKVKIGREGGNLTVVKVAGKNNRVISAIVLTVLASLIVLTVKILMDEDS